MKLKNELSMEGVRYEEITKTEAEEKGFWNPVWTTVPQLWLYKKHIGGYTDYIAYKQSDNTETVSSYDDSDGTYNECKSCEA
jgi:glutaredoxin